LTLLEALKYLDDGYAIRHSTHLRDHYLIVDKTSRNNFLVDENGKLAGIHLHGYTYYNLIRGGWSVLWEIERYKYITFDDEKFKVKSISMYEPTSILAGQDKITFLDMFDTLEEAQKKYPDAELLEYKDAEPKNTYEHIKED